MSYPNNRHGNTPPYLLSAYGIAVKHGYSGSEEEWLASLKGDQGEYPRLSYQTPTSGDEVQHGIFYRYADEGDWTNLCWLDDLMTAAEADIINAAKEYADTAEAYAKGTVDGEAVEEGDPGYEDNAKYYAGQASTYASAAGGFATGASNYAQAASGYATTASGHADNAATSATAAAGSATSAAGSAASASNSAGSASTSASAAEAQATQAGTYAYNADQSAQQAASYAAAANTAYSAVVDVANGVDVKVEDIETQVSIAAGYASAAGTSATNASGSATAAAGSATAAAGSASNAAASAQAAAGSAEDAQEVLDSIPEDYSELSDDVTDLKSATNEIVNGFALSAADFQKGGINDSGVNDSYRDGCRCRNTLIVSYPFDITYSVNTTNCVFTIHFYTAQGVHINSTGWKTSYTVPANSHFRMAMEGRYQQSSETLSIDELLAKIDVSIVSLKSLKTDIDNLDLSGIYADVTDFGAVGDGVTDDTRAIQDALESIKTTGGTVFLPSGTYYINSVLFDTSDSGRASSLHIHSNCRFLMDTNAVMLRGSGTQRVLMTHNAADATEYNGCSNIIIEGGTFDANATLNENSCMAIFTHGDNITIKNARFIGSKGVWHAIECNSSRNVLIDGCTIETDATNGAIDIDAANNSGNLGVDDHTVCYNVMVQNCAITTKWKPAIQNHTAYAQHDIRIHDNVFYMRAGTDTPAVVAFANTVTKIDVYNNTFHNTNPSGNGYPFKMDTADLTSTYHDNRAEGFDASYPSGNCTGYNNMLNGTFVS